MKASDEKIFKLELTHKGRTIQHIVHGAEYAKGLAEAKSKAADTHVCLQLMRWSDSGLLVPAQYKPRIFANGEEHQVHACMNY